MANNNGNKLALWAGIAGNVVDHYDTALYAFLAPFLAEVFFPGHDADAALILAYGVTATSVFSRPLGAIIFGTLAARIGTRNVLIITLTCVAFATSLMGILPTYNEVGVLAPILLILTRIFQTGCASGEHSVAAFFIMDRTISKRRGAASGYYLMSTMVGITAASWVATWVSKTSNPSYYWRYAFLSGVIAILVGLFLRMVSRPDEKPKPREYKICIRSSIKTNFISLSRLVAITSFSYMTYAIPFVFLNSYIPMLQPNYTKAQMLEVNSILLLIDIMLIPIFGAIADKFNHAKWMRNIAAIIGISVIPLFVLLPYADLTGIFFIRSWIVVLGVAFAAPTSALLFHLLKTNEKYLLNGLGSAIGTEIFGRNTTTICLILAKYFATTIAPAFYIALLSLFAFVALSYKIDNNLFSPQKTESQ